MDRPHVLGLDSHMVDMLHRLTVVKNTDLSEKRQKDGASHICEKIK